VEAITDLPMVNDIDADYSPQYVKLARILRGKITSGELKHSDSLLATELAAEYSVSALVARAALDMLAANRYIGRPGRTRFYRVTWDTAHHARAGNDHERS
jgi:DNA-binding GntR family transcriptional regulator